MRIFWVVVIIGLLHMHASKSGLIARSREYMLQSEKALRRGSNSPAGCMEVNPKIYIQRMETLSHLHESPSESPNYLVRPTPTVTPYLDVL
jgi:hypothetical protein